MKTKKIILISILLLSSFKCIGQNVKIDSLTILFNGYKENDEKKYNLLSKIFHYYYLNQYHLKALNYSDSLIWFAQKTKITDVIADAYFLRAGILQNQGNVNDAIILYKEIIKNIERETSPKMLYYKVILFNNFGRALQTTNKFDSSLFFFQKSSEISYLLKDTANILINNNCIGNLFMDLADWNTASEYMERNISHYEKNKILLTKNSFFKFIYLETLRNIGYCQLSLKRYSTALNYFMKVNEFNKIWDIAISNALTSALISSAYFGTGDYLNSYRFSNISFQYDTVNNFKINLIQDYTNFARIFRDAPDSLLIKWNIDLTKRYDTVIKLLTNAIGIAKSQTSLSLEETPTEEMSIVYERMNDYLKAYEYYKRFKIIHDSIGSASQQKRILINNMKFRFSKQTDSLKYAESIKQSNLQQLVLKNQQQYLLANRQALLVTKEKELQHLTYLKTQADLQNASLLNTQNEKELKLSIKEKQIQTVQVNKLSKDMELSAFKLKQQKLIWLAAISFLSLLSFFIIYNSWLRRKRMTAVFEKEKAHQLLTEAELKNNLNEISMSALRSQMNPHFIFNVLNSINKYILTSDINKASEYLVGFSKLIRLVLENSKATKVSLQADVEALQLYITMEKLRFEDKFESEIIIDKNIDTQFVMIPPLIIQPFVENAIWHGLLHKDGNNKLMIDISQPENNLLLITIIDNGIGRVKSMELKSKSAIKNKSFGMQITSERIGLGTNLMDNKNQINIEDLYDKNGNVSGTCVNLRLEI